MPTEPAFKVDDYVVDGDGVVSRIVGICVNCEDSTTGQTMLTTRVVGDQNRPYADKPLHEIRVATLDEVLRKITGGVAGLVDAESFHEFEKLDPEIVNAQINYMYRDADNYKYGGHVVFGGAISLCQLEDLFANLDEDDHGFIPGQIGIRDLQGDATGGWQEESDHPWHNVRTVSLTMGAPTDDRTIGKFMTIVKETSWDGSYRPECADAAPSPG